MTTLVFLDPEYPDGRPADASAPQLLATDLGVTRGDGVFESLLAVDGRPRKLEAHLSRLARSAGALQIQAPADEAWRRAIATALAAGDGDDGGPAVVRLFLTRGPEGSGTPTAWVSAAPVPAATLAQRKAGVKVLLLDRGYDSLEAPRQPWLLLGAKTLSYAVNMAAIRYAREHGADDVIFTSSDGRVLEGATSSVLLAMDIDGVRTLMTPELESGILPGTTQAAVFAAAERAGWALGYGPLEPVHLLEADAVWLASSIRLLAPVTHIDGQPIRTSQRLTAELAALVEDVL